MSRSRSPKVISDFARSHGWSVESEWESEDGSAVSAYSYGDSHTVTIRFARNGRVQQLFINRDSVGVAPDREMVLDHLRRVDEQQQTLVKVAAVTREVNSEQ
jgi:hypothetical protein